MKTAIGHAGVQRPAAALLAALLLGGGVAGTAASLFRPGPARATTHASIGTAQPVPASLTAAESSAEDLVDLALRNERSKVVAKAAELKSVAHGPAASALRRANVPTADIALLGKRADRVAVLASSSSMVRVALAANGVSELMPGLYGRFADRVPASVLALDYLDREAQLRSMAREQPAVVSASQGLAETWTALRPKVVAAGGRAEARMYDAHVAAMKRLSGSLDRKALQREAARGLELVDALESVFA